MMPKLSPKITSAKFVLATTSGETRIFLQICLIDSSWFDQTLFPSARYRKQQRPLAAIRSGRRAGRFSAP